MAADAAVHPQLEEHGSFEHLRLGRVEKFHDPRTLRLATYLDDAVLLPEIPAAQDWTTDVAAWPMYGNDSLGDCTCAAAGHMIQAWTAAAGAPRQPGDQDVLDLYWETGSDDTGRYEVDVLNFWRNQGIAGDRIEAYAYVDPQNLDHVRAAIYLFGGLFSGIALPKTAQGQQVWDVVGDGQTGDSQPGSWGGHAVPYVAYDAAGFKVVTWAAILALTDAFHLAYCDELYAPISQDFLNAGKTPAGFDLAALLADLDELTRQTGGARSHDDAPVGPPDVDPEAPASPIEAGGQQRPDSLTWGVDGRDRAAENMPDFGDGYTHDG